MAIKDQVKGQHTPPVIIAGAGPTGLTLATELRRAGVGVLLLERRADRGQDGSRAAGMQPRTIELLDQRGIVDRFVAAGPQTQLGNFAGIPLDYTALPTRFPYTLNIMQADTERVLEDCAAELGVEVCWSTAVTAVQQDADGVDVTIDGPRGIETVRGRYLVACDGGRSTIRKLAGVAFPGTDSTMISLIGDVELDDPPQRPLFLDRREHGTITAIQFRPGWHRVVTAIPRQNGDEPKDPVTLEQLREAVRHVAGTDFGMHTPHWLSHFSDSTRQVEHYRIGRILLAGDAAHIHAPAGGQGMNMGMQDAFNLGWKLSAVVNGDAPEQLLDTYHDERHSVGSDTLNVIRAQVALLGLGEPITELRRVLRRLIDLPEANAYLGATLSGLAIRYPFGEGHPLLGRRVPDVTIRCGGTTSTINNLLHPAKAVLLDFSDSQQLHDATAGWKGRVNIIQANCPADPWALPAAETVSAPPALLIRPDGYVSWVSDASHDLTQLRHSLTTTYGPGTHA